MLGMVQVVGLGGGEQDFLHPLAAQQPRQKRVLAGAEGRQDASHRAALFLDRHRPLVDRAKRVDQHDLPVDAREMIAEEGLHNPVAIGVVAPLHLAVEATT